MSSLRRLGIHKVCLRRRALTSHLLRHFWCFAVLKLRLFAYARTKPQSITDVFSRLWTPQGEKDLFKTVCFLASTGLGRIFCCYLSVMPRNAAHLPSARRAPRMKPVSVRFLKILSSSPSMQAVM